MTPTAKLTGRSYDGLTAYWCAVLSDLAYADEAEIRGASERYGGRLVDCWDVGNAQGFAAEVDGVLVVSIRGTTPTELRDIATDARIAQTGGPFGSSKVHRGFLAHAKTIEPLVSELVQSFDGPVILCGHSLGAAAAQLLAAMLLHDGQEVDAVYTYGSPRVGNSRFCGILDYELARSAAAHYRHVNACDVVTRAPWCLGKYRHGGRLKYFTTGGRLLDQPRAWRVWADQLWTLRAPWTWARRSVADHATENYRRLCAAQVWN